MGTAEEVVPKEVLQILVVELPRGVALLDTGCKRAVGGSRWHREMQSALRNRKLSFERVPQREYFKFGPGDPILSVTGWKYPVGVNGMMSSIFISEIDAELPALVGPDELSEWKSAADF